MVVAPSLLLTLQLTPFGPLSHHSEEHPGQIYQGCLGTMASGFLASALWKELESCEEPV